MMKCKAARRLFSAAFDGELSASEERQFKEHLAACAICSREFVLFSRSVELVASLPRPSSSPLFEEKVIRALGEEETGPRRRPELPVPLAAPRPALAFAVALVLVGLLLVAPWNQSDWESALVSRRVERSEVAMKELAKSATDVADLAGMEKRSLTVATLDGIDSASSERQSLFGEELSLWKSKARIVAGGSTENAIALLDEVAYSDGAVFEIEFVLDPFLFEGAEVRRLDASSLTAEEMELASATF
ncbi:MAG: zf-HC2 domain-containing protein [Candidatus Eiseniibacteriota bacterium]|nr:MAG: zf-HC2 domain-containing protein [Candidatus Eisenbacteria bacterium]